jgi:predicted transcriptional regulator
MFRFVASLFGCAHRHCTFPITSKKLGAALPEDKACRNTYIVCLDCGREFPYDWQQMKVVAAAKRAA